MATPSADSATCQLLRTLAAANQFTFVSKQAASDLMAYHLTPADVGDGMVEWIDAGERVKQVTIHSIPDRVGDEAFEVKPKIDKTKYYVKVSIDDRGGPDEGLALLSVHMDH